MFASEAGSGLTNWYLTDAQGTVRDVMQYDTDTTTPVDHLVYSSVGQLTNQTASANSGDQPTFYYNGAWQDPQTGLNKMAARWYDAVDAVFASQDPIGFLGGQTNLSEFVGNSPTNFVDPSGLAAAALEGGRATYVAPTVPCGGFSHILTESVAGNGCHRLPSRRPAGRKTAAEARPVRSRPSLCPT